MIKKILNDTLKNSSGKYSRKNLTMLVSFACSVSLGFALVYGEWIGKVFDKSLYVFDSFLLMAGYSGLLTVADKKIKTKGDNDVT